MGVWEAISDCTWPVYGITGCSMAKISRSRLQDLPADGLSSYQYQWAIHSYVGHQGERNIAHRSRLVNEGSAQNWMKQPG